MKRTGPSIHDELAAGGPETKPVRQVLFEPMGLAPKGPVDGPRQQAVKALDASEGDDLHLLKEAGAVRAVVARALIAHRVGVLGLPRPERATGKHGGTPGDGDDPAQGVEDDIVDGRLAEAGLAGRFQDLDDLGEVRRFLLVRDVV